MDVSIPSPAPAKEEISKELEQEMFEPQSEEVLVRVKRDPEDAEEPAAAADEPAAAAEELPATPAPPVDYSAYSLAPKEEKPSSLGYLGEVVPGFLRVTVHRFHQYSRHITELTHLCVFHRAEDLVDKDIAGKSDPYVVIK